MFYNVQMKTEDFFKIHNRIVAERVEIKDKNVTFKIDMTSYKFLKKSGYKFKIIDSMNNKLKGFFVRYYIVLIGILFVFSILYIDSYRVSGIRFNKETEINNEIENIIKSKYKRLLWIDYCNLDYESLSLNLRKKYSSYPYINVYEKNNEIIVDIFNYDEKYTGLIENINGNIISKKDAVIDMIYVYSGTSEVYKNKYVKKGDVLISGVLSEDVVVSAKGLVMGYTYEMKNISIPKEFQKEFLTNNIETYNRINIFSLGFNMGKKNSFEHYEYLTTTTFNLYNIFCIEKVIEKEKKYEKILINSDKAVELAFDKIDNDFNKNRTSEKEVICKKSVYKIEENDIEFIISIIVKSYESIGVFNALWCKNFKVDCLISKYSLK